MLLACLMSILFNEYNTAFEEKSSFCGRMIILVY